MLALPFSLRVTSETWRGCKEGVKRLPADAATDYFFGVLPTDLPEEHL
jgi:hypothetical protein